MGRAPCCDKANVKRGPWSPEEDATLKTYLEIHGTAGNWISLPSKAGLKRCGKSCRLRWLNYLRPNIKHGGFTDEEDSIIFNLHSQLGSRWSVIASQLPGRTDNDVKNYWNTKLKKKKLLTEQGKMSFSPKSSANNFNLSCSNPSLPYFPQEEENSFTLPNFSDVNPRLTVKADQGMSLEDPVDLYHSGLIDLTKFDLSQEEGSGILDPSSIAINNSFSLVGVGDVKENGVFVDFSSAFPHDLVNVNGLCFQERANHSTLADFISNSEIHPQGNTH